MIADTAGGLAAIVRVSAARWVIVYAVLLAGCFGGSGSGSGASGVSGGAGAGASGAGSGAGGTTTTGAGGAGSGAGGTAGVSGTGSGGAGSGSGGIGGAGSGSGAVGGAGSGSGAVGGAGIGAGSGGGTQCPPECLRAFTCAASCADEPFNNGCCACPAGTIDTITCPANSDAGYCAVPCTGAAPADEVVAACQAITTQQDCLAYTSTAFPYACAWQIPGGPPCLAP